MERRLLGLRYAYAYATALMLMPFTPAVRHGRHATIIPMIDKIDDE